MSSIGNRDANAGSADPHSTSRRRRIRFYRVLLTSAALLSSLIVAEAMLRWLERSQLGDRDIESSLVADPVLGYKLQPFTRGHDANGFRNDSLPQHADIVSLGDSQTWGVNAQRQDAWPQQLSKLSKRSVYSMALGGFGPVQYRVLIPQALKFSPKIIVVGLYLGNDLYDAYNMAYHYAAYQDLHSRTAGDLSLDTVREKADAAWDEEKRFHASFGRANPSSWSYWLREHLAIGRLLNRTHLCPGSEDIDYEIDKRWATAHPDQGAICDWPGRETVFTTAYRLAGLDLDEPRIAEGLRISKELLSEMQTETTTNQKKLVVLLLPTKETVYATAQGGKLDVNSNYRKLVEQEGRARSEIISECQNKNIAFVDALPYLSAALERGERVYPTTTESHPNPQGYFVIAAAVNERIGKLE